MSKTTPTPPPESDPFHQPLAPLPAAPKGKAKNVSKPKAVAVQAPQMEPEKILPAENEMELGAVERIEPESDLSTSSRTPAARWKFWKRPSKRDLQLETLRQGATEMVSLMRSIRDHLDVEQGEREGIRRSLSPLPVAVESLKSMSESQANTGKMLGELRTTIERRAEKDSIFIKSLNRIGSTMSKVDKTFGTMDRTLSGMDQSNQQTAKTMETLGERVSESGRFMNETFARLRDAEREFTDHITRNARRGNMAMLGICGILMISVFAVGFMFKENRELLSAVQNNGALVVQVPKQEQEHAPAEGMAIFEDLKQVDDGIAEPDREIVGTQIESKKPSKNVVPVGTDGKPLLSANPQGRRE